MRTITRAARLIHDILRERAQDRPDKVALICDGKRLTYKQIDLMSDRLANALRERGVGDGDRVLFYLLNGCEQVVGIFAALKANAVFVGVDAGNTFDTLKKIAANCGAAGIFSYAQKASALVDLFEQVPSLRVAVLAGTPGGGLPERFLWFDKIQEDYSPKPIPCARIDGDLAYLIYTSGSTGESKGVMVTHRSILFTIRSGIEYFSLSEDDIQLSPLQLSFSPGINQLLQAFLAGGTLILEKSLAFPTATLKKMETEKATGFSAVPTMISLLMQQDLSRYDLSRLRYVTSIGAALPPALIERIRKALPNASIYSYYGMAEASYSLGLDPQQIDSRPTSVGKPFPGTQAWIIDENGNRLPPEAVGELILRGSHVRSGYWNSPEATAKRFWPGLLPGETVCHTGDMFKTDAEGFFYFIGRSDEIIKSGAKKVVPKEIENALYAMEGVVEAAVIGIPDPILGQAIKAFIVPEESARSSMTAENVLQHCRKNLEAYKVPREVEICECLPKTSSGKIAKKSLA